MDLANCENERAAAIVPHLSAKLPAHSGRRLDDLRAGLVGVQIPDPRKSG